MNTEIFGIFPGTGTPMSLMEYLNNSSFDELVEIDFLNDRCRNIYHVEGKYFVPVTIGSYSDLYHYAMDHIDG